MVESALLTHGLVSVSNAELLAHWPSQLCNIVWVDAGRICIGPMEEYLPFRDRAKALCRIDCDYLEEALQSGVSGALTASGTMAVCCKMGIPLAVTCGMGGIGDIRGEELCPDLPALEKIPAALLSTAPKDMLDIAATVEYLQCHGVEILGVGTDRCTGYIFHSADVALSGKLEGLSLPKSEKLLLLNPIPESARIRDNTLLAQGIAAGKEAEKTGGYYHPAANAAFDRLTKGMSSRMQMESIIANAFLAEQLTR